MIRRLPVKPIVAAQVTKLPVKVLVALPELTSQRSGESFFNLPGAVNAELGEWRGALKVMIPKIWAPGWTPTQLHYFLDNAPPPLSSLPTNFSEVFGTSNFEFTGYAVVHCVGTLSDRGNPRFDDDPRFTVADKSYSAGALRDALVRSHTRLLILETLESTSTTLWRTEDSSTRMVRAKRLAEFIVGAGGPAVLIITGDHAAVNSHLANVYSAILRNQPLEEVARLDENEPQVLLVYGEGADYLLQFDSVIEDFENRLNDYSSLVKGLLRDIRSLRDDQLHQLGDSVFEPGSLEQLDSQIDSELALLNALKTKPWDREYKGALFLTQIADRLATIEKDIGLHSGEGNLHTKYDDRHILQQFLPKRWSASKEVSVEPEHDQQPFTEVTIFFGTNRQRAGEVAYYGTGRDVMHYGRCLVSVPSDRRLGSLPRPSLWDLFREDRKKHFTIPGIVECDRDNFVSDLRTYINACRTEQALVFVHGFNVTFADAVLRTAQIVADLNFLGAPIVFSWPSKGVFSPIGYIHDETQVRWALPDLRTFLEIVVEQSGATTIHLLAHSMGNRALTDALCLIGAAAAQRSPAIFNELILTAPDIDAETFTRDIAPVFTPTAKRVTLYASSNDRALKFSKRIHGYTRAGESGSRIVLVKGIDTIDVSSVDTSLIGHSYYGGNRSVLSDMFNLINGQPAAGRFGLRKRTRRLQDYWVFQPSTRRWYQRIITTRF